MYGHQNLVFVEGGEPSIVSIVPTSTRDTQIRVQTRKTVFSTTADRSENKRGDSVIFPACSGKNMPNRVSPAAKRVSRRESATRNTPSDARCANQQLIPTRNLRRCKSYAMPYRSPLFRIAARRGYLLSSPATINRRGYFFGHHRQ